MPCFMYVIYVYKNNRVRLDRQTDKTRQDKTTCIYFEPNFVRLFSFLSSVCLPSSSPPHTATMLFPNVSSSAFSSSFYSSCTYTTHTRETKHTHTHTHSPTAAIAGVAVVAVYVSISLSLSFSSPMHVYVCVYVQCVCVCVCNHHHPLFMMAPPTGQSHRHSGVSKRRTKKKESASWTSPCSR